MYKIKVIQKVFHEGFKASDGEIIEAWTSAETIGGEVINTADLTVMLNLIIKTFPEVTIEISTNNNKEEN